ASATGMLRREVGRQTGVRLTPTLEFIHDAVPENARTIEDLLVQARHRDAEVARTKEGAAYAGDADPYRVPREDDDSSDDRDDSRSAADRAARSGQSTQGAADADEDTDSEDRPA
ncbi:ribosome-binding factor A, partial [Enterobacter roggenkampii]